MNSEVSALLADAGMLMLTGMTVVFIFLVLVIGAIHLIAALHRVLPATESDGDGAVDTASSVSSSSQGPSRAVIAAISAAIHQHRQKH